MTKPLLSAMLVASLLAATGCANLEPTLPQADAAIPAQWPLPPVVGRQPAQATAATSSSMAAGGPGSAVKPVPSAVAATTSAEQTLADGVATHDIGWREFFTDTRLQTLIEQALANNRDLRVAVLNVERARAAYGIARADRFPTVAAGASQTRSGGNTVNPDRVYTASLGVSAFELDLFGRVRNLGQAALEQYFAQEEGQRSAQLSLIAEIANAYLTLAADRQSLQVAQATLDNQRGAYDLVVKRHQLGALSGLELSQAQTTVESARADVARYAGFIATDLNALSLLVGSPVDPALLPPSLDTSVSGLAPLPVGLPSDVLLRRPDVRQTEHALRAANANVGAARAAFFPSISLTGSIGSTSTELSGLFGSGSRVWSFMPQITLPIFDAGRLGANLGVSKADRDIALARYEQSIQVGFREVADALALTATLSEQRQAQAALLEAADRGHRLSTARHDRGLDSYLVLLDAQRTLYSAQQSLVSAQLAEQANRVTLYKVLGGGWRSARDAN